MQYVCLDRFGCFAALVAASYGTGELLPEANYRQILSLPNFARSSSHRPRELAYRGKDEWGNKYYTLGVGVYGSFLKDVLAPEILRLLPQNEQVKIYDFSKFNPWYMSCLELLWPRQFRKWIVFLWAYSLGPRMPLIMQSMGNIHHRKKQGKK